MNILSAISIIIYTSFFIGAVHVLTPERKGVLNVSASAVLISLGWWSFCNSFFFAAITTEQAWFWHKLSAMGWCGFVAFTAYYFVALTNSNKKNPQWWKQVLFFVPMVFLICVNLFGETTSLAQNIIQSTSGWGWTYQNSLTSFWLWVYLLYVALYFGLAFYLLYNWSKSAKHKMKREMAIWFIILDTLTILCGVITDVVLPLTSPILPALASVATAFFGIGYFSIIYRHDVFNINLVISSDDILQTSNNSIFVMDENSEILKYNYAIGSLLGYNKTELIGGDFKALIVDEIDFTPLYKGEDLINIEGKLRCKNGIIKDVLLSASVAKDKKNSFLCIIVSCQDVSKQKNIQEELKIEREKYKKLAQDYQLLAYYDPLTGLANRRRFFEVLNDFENLYHTKQEDFAVFFMDLDNFKHANDVYGHKGGDELLIAAANKLRNCLEQGDFVARLGGDEFMMIMPYKEDIAIEHKMKQIKDAFHQKIFFYGAFYEIGISVGYGVFSQSGNATKLMQKADEAMYGNKKKPFDGTDKSIVKELL
ncbi:MAG: diguanylate cyclase [Clostridiales bacterium]